jgi:hypothetical protein
MKSLSPLASSYTASADPNYDASKDSSPSASAIVVTTVAPVDLAILLKSYFGTLLNPIHPASIKYLFATSSIPLVVRITFAPALRIFSTLSFKISHSLYLIFSKFLGSSTNI